LELPRLSCSRPFIRSNTFSWYTSTAEARIERTPGVRMSSSAARGNTPHSSGADEDEEDAADDDAADEVRDAARHRVTSASTRHPAGPNIVCVFPLPVWPYATSVQSYPASARFTNGAQSASYATAWSDPTTTDEG
jgi:hypothetical protein